MRLIRSGVVMLLGIQLLMGQAWSQGEEVLRAAGVPFDRPGVCLNLGSGDGRLAVELAQKTKYFVFALALDEADCERTRQALDKIGAYGTRATAMSGSLREIPFPNGYGNLIVTGDYDEKIDLKEVRRVLNPDGLALVGGANASRAKIEAALKQAGITDYKVSGNYAIIRGRMPEGSDDWTHFKHGPENNPVSSETAIRPPFRTQWVAGEPGYAFHINPAVIAQGRVVLNDASEGYRRPSQLWAWDSFNGTLLWKHELKLPYQYHTLVVVKDTVYVLDKDKILVLDAATGREIRTLEVSNGNQPVGRYLRLAVVDDVLYLQTQGSAEIKKYTIAGDGPMGELFFALSLKDGGLLWKYRSPAPGLTYSMVLGGGALYYYAPEAGVIALDLKTGRELWKNTELAGLLKVVRYDNHNWATYHDGLVYFFTNKTVALDTRTGKVQWNKATVGRGLMFVGDKAYSHPYFGKSIVMFDPRTGSALGEIPCYLPGCGTGTGSTSGIYSAGQGFGVYDFATKKRFVYDVFRVSCSTGIIPANGLIFQMPGGCGCAYPIVGPAALAPAAGWTIPEGRQDLDKRLLRGPAFDAAPADEQAKEDWPCYRANPGHTAVTGNAPKLPLAMGWQQKLSGRPTAPSVAGGLVFVGSDAGYVWGLDAGNGQVRWKFTCGGSVPVTPAYSQGRVLFGSHDGWVYALEGATGKLAWKFRAAPQERYVNLQGRMVSTWPVQTGVVVEDGKAYFAAGLCSYDGGYLYALEVKSGKLIWVGQIGHLTELQEGVNPQGAMALSGELLFIPQGGDKPAAFKKADGSVAWWHGAITSRSMHPFDGSREKYGSGVNYENYLTKVGGSEVVAEGDAILFGGPRLIGGGSHAFLIASATDGWSYGTQEAIKAGKVKKLEAAYTLRPEAGSSTPVLTPDVVFTLGIAYDRKKLSALHLVARKEREKPVAEAVLWSAKPGNAMHAGALAGSVFLAAGDSDVVALDSKDGRELSRVKLPAKVLRNGLAVAGSRVYAVTMEGSVFCLSR